MPVMKFSVPGRPERWRRPAEDTRPGKRAHRFVDKKTAAARKRILDEAKLHWTAEPWIGPVVIGVTAVFAIPASWPKYLRERALAGKVLHIADPDYDQIVKLVMDALKGLAYVDDNQVAGILPRSAKRYGDPERTDIELHFLEPEIGAETPGQRRMERKRLEQAELIRTGRLGRVAQSPKTKSEGK